MATKTNRADLYIKREDVLISNGKNKKMTYQTELHQRYATVTFIVYVKVNGKWDLKYTSKRLDDAVDVYDEY